MQDLIWGDFDLDGDLIVSWRDRRNGFDETYQTSSEIWAAYRAKNTSDFSQNFQISNQSVDFDIILESAGNDFMNIQLQDDILNATWGDTRDGNLNIWFQRMEVNGNVLSVQQISSEEIPLISIYPNPVSSTITIQSQNLEKIIMYDLKGKIILSKTNFDQKKTHTINLEQISNGMYLIYIISKKAKLYKKILKK